MTRPRQVTVTGHMTRPHDTSTARPLQVTVTGRVKTVPSTLRKLLRDVDDVEAVRDVLALRLVLAPSVGAAAELAASLEQPTLSRPEAEALLCYAAYKQVVTRWREEPGRFKDLVAHPKPNGYQSLHTNARAPASLSSPARHPPLPLCCLLG